jgi:hypothetical protein
MSDHVPVKTFSGSFRRGFQSPLPLVGYSLKPIKPYCHDRFSSHGDAPRFLENDGAAEMDFRFG